MGSAIFKKPPLKKLSKEGFFGVDLHFHTRYSPDAVARIPAAVKKAEKKGFGFAITDHNTVDGIKHSYRYRHKTLIIPGVEVTCNNGNHILAYFYDHPQAEEFYDKVMKPRMKNNPFFVNISVEELMECSKDYNCLIAAPHPFAVGAVGVMHTGMSRKVERSLKMVEVINGYNFRKSNIDAIMWASKKSKGMTGGSDGHSTYELGKVLTFTQGHDTEEIFKEILKDKSMVLGKEDNIFLKAVMGVSKETTYVETAGKKHLSRKLIRSQLGTEYRYIKEKFRNGKAYAMLTRQHEFYKKQSEQKNKWKGL